MESTDENPIRLNTTRATASIGRARLATGFSQGIAAWLLLRLVAPFYYARAGGEPVNAPYWSSRHPMVFAALALVTAYIPVLAIAELGRMRRAALALYIALAAAIVAALAAYDIWRDPLQASGEVRIWPSFTLCFCASLGLFIVNQLLEHRERGDSLFTRYANYFEDSWVRGFQLVVSVVFALLVWGLLALGAGLFHLIHLEWFNTLIGHNWFRCPTLAAAFAAAVHITDVRPALLKGVRNVGLTLLSWLLPLVVTLGAGFLAALTFVGIKPLWATGHAAAILLWAGAITILLLNAAYKDGDPSSVPPAALRWTGRIAGPVVLSLATLASVAIGLRVYQHGWTPERVFSTAAAFMAVVYGIGYTYAAMRRGGWLHELERVNVLASLFIVAILALLLSPAADPARVSVDSQLRRLAAGAVARSAFDYGFLRFESGRFGSQALAQLAAGADQEVRSRAALMLQTKTRTFRPSAQPDPAATEPAFAHATVYPKDTPLPEDFRHTDFSNAGTYAPGCLRDGTHCDIYIVPFGAPGESAILVRMVKDDATPRPGYLPISAEVFQRNREGQWVHTGAFSTRGCPGIVAALRDGTVTPVRPDYDDLMVNGMRLRFAPAPHGDDPCAGAPAPTPAVNSPRDADAPARMGPAFAKP
jgi:hypothetical protein